MLIGFNAPDFTAPAILPDGKLVADFCLSENTLEHSYSKQTKKFILLLFFPYLFSHSSHRMLHQFNQNLHAISQKSMDLIAISVDSHYCQKAALKIERLAKDGDGIMGLKGLNFPLVSDFDHTISQSYQILHPEKNVAVSSVFLIDQKFMVRYQQCCDLAASLDCNSSLSAIESLIKI